MKSRFLIIALSLGFIALISCGGRNTVTPVTEGPIIAQGVTIIDTMPSLTLIDTAVGVYSFSFAGAAPQLDTGAIIVGSAENGFLRRVTAVTTLENTLSISTQPAVLTDAVIAGGVVTALQLPIGEDDDPGDRAGIFRPVWLAKGVEVASDGIDLSGLELFSGSIEGTQAEILIDNGSVTFDPAVDFGFEIRDGQLSEFHALAGGSMAIVCDLNLSSDGPLTLERTLQLAKFEHRAIEYIGEVPVVSVITLQFDAGISVKTDKGGSVRYTTEGTFGLLFGSRTHEEGWLSIWNPGVTLVGDLIAWPGDGDTEIEVTISPTVSIAFYGLSGPILAVDPHIAFDGELMENRLWRWALTGGVDGTAVIDLGTLERDLSYHTTTFANLEATIIADSGLIIDTWQTTLGGADDDEANAIVATADGGYAIAGSTQSYGQGSHDVFLVKVDPFGAVQWQRTFGGSDEDFGYDLVVLDDGSLVIAGETRSFGAGDERAFVIKTDANGETVWQHYFGIEATARAITQTADGGFVVAGRARLKRANSMGMYLARLRADGTIVWEKTYTRAFTATAVLTTPSGEIIATGYARTPQLADAHVLKVDSNGNDIWNRTFGGYNLDYGEDLIVTANGSYLVAGSTRSFGGTGTDVYLLRLGEDGTLQWSRNYTGNNDRQAEDVGRALTNAHDGGYVIAGNTDSFSDSFGDLYLFKINEVGTRLWQRHYGGAGFDAAHAIIRSSDGGYVLVGRTTSSGAGGADIYLVKTDSRGNIKSAVSGG